MIFKESSEYTIDHGCQQSWKAKPTILTCTYVEDNTVWLISSDNVQYKLYTKTNKLYVYNQSCASYDTVEPSVASTLKEKSSYSAKDVNVYLGYMQIDGWYGD